MEGVKMDNINQNHTNRILMLRLSFPHEKSPTVTFAFVRVDHYRIFGHKHLREYRALFNLNHYL